MRHSSTDRHDVLRNNSKLIISLDRHDVLRNNSNLIISPDRHDVLRNNSNLIISLSGNKDETRKLKREDKTVQPV